MDGGNAISCQQPRRSVSRALYRIEGRVVHFNNSLKDYENKMQTLLFDIPVKGERLPPMEGVSFFPVYKNKNNALYEGDSIEWLKSLKSETVDLIFADPPYNIKKAYWDKFESQEKYIQWSMKWVEEAARVLKKTGSLYICGFS